MRPHFEECLTKCCKLVEFTHIKNRNMKKELAKLAIIIVLVFITGLVAVEVMVMSLSSTV